MDELQHTNEVPNKPIRLKTLVQSIHPGFPFTAVLGVDRFLIDHHFDKRDPRLFSKAGLYKAVEGAIARPESYIFELPDSKDRTDNMVETTVASLSDILKKHKAAYLKSGVGSAGHGMVKLVQSEKTLTLIIPRGGIFNDIARKGNEYQQLNPKDIIIFYPNPTSITIPMERPGMHQPLNEILIYLTKHMLPNGEYIVEAPINIPLYEGRTWEIRNIIQCPGRVPRITARFAKVGEGKDFSNIMLGGKAELPEKVIEEILRQNQGGDKNIEELAKEYLEENNTAALRTAEALNAYMRNLARQEFDPRDAELFYAREFSVDITGEFDDEQNLKPVLGEVQYPLRPEVSYVPTLEEINPKELTIVEATKKKIDEIDQEALAKLET